MRNHDLSRREWLAAGGAALGSLALGGRAMAKDAPTSTVSIARCTTYDRAQLAKTLSTQFDQIGGIGSLVKGKTVALKLNLTGNPRSFPDDPALPYRTQPDTVLAVAQLIARAGAQRIRMIETFFPATQEMESVGALRARYRRHQQRGLQGGMGERPEHGTGQAVRPHEGALRSATSSPPTT